MNSAICVLSQQWSWLKICERGRCFRLINNGRLNPLIEKFHIF
jgi:hypothetical protein